VNSRRHVLVYWDGVVTCTAVSPAYTCTDFTKFNKVSSVMGRDDSWPATMPSTLQFIGETDLETPKMAELYFRSWI